jgi:hypothetical protein
MQYRTKEQSTKILNKFTNSTSGQLNLVATQLKVRASPFLDYFILAYICRDGKSMFTK